MPGHAARRVLVVDDDARVRAALLALIEASWGLVVCGQASSGPQALRAGQELAPDVVLLDLVLPSAEVGLDILARLVEAGRTVVALSIRGTLRDAALDAGAVAFLEKGTSPDLLLQALRDAAGPDVTD